MSNSTAKTARQKSAQMRAEAARRDARRRSVMIGAAVAVVVVIVVVVGVVIQNARKDSTAASAPPANLVDGSIMVGKATAPVTVTMYEDFQCPVCANSEKLNSAQLATWVSDGTVKIAYRPIAILDRTSPDEYSTRALNAAAAVVDAAPASFAAFHAALFEQQPAEGAPGLTTDQLVAAAVAAGAPQAPVRADIEAGTYDGWAAATTDAASKAGVTGTPTILVDGKKLADYQPATLDAAVAAAAG